MSHKLLSSGVFPNPDFPLRVMRVRDNSPGRARPASLHSHEFHELVVVMKGQGRHFTDDGQFVLEAGDVFLVRGDAAHGYGETSQLNYVNILFLPAMLQMPTADLNRLAGYHVLFRIEPKLRREHQLRGCLKLSSGQLTEAAQYVAHMEDELIGARPGHHFMATTYLMHLIGYLSRCESESSQPERRKLLKIGEVLSHIERGFARTITIDELCEIADMSESSLTRAFNGVMGRPPMDHVIYMRVTKAAEMLRATDDRITDIAFRCGFSDSNYFSRQFRRVMNTTPREYRKRG